MPEALAVDSHLCQEIFTRNNLTRKRVIDIVVLPLDWGGRDYLKAEPWQFFLWPVSFYLTYF